MGTDVASPQGRTTSSGNSKRQLIDLSLAQLAAKHDSSKVLIKVNLAFSSVEGGVYSWCSFSVQRVVDLVGVIFHSSCCSLLDSDFWSR